MGDGAVAVPAPLAVVPSESTESKSEATPQEKAEPKEPPKPKSWKFDDEEYNDPDELAKAYKTKRAEAKQAEEYRKFLDTAWQDREKLATFQKRGKEDLDGLLKELGHNPSEYARKKLLAEMEEEQLSPEQKATREEKSKREGLEKRLKDFEEREEKAKLDEFREKQKRYYVETINTALKESGIPPTAEVQSRMAQLLKANLKYGYQIPAVILAKEAQKELDAEQEYFLTRMDPKALAKKYPNLAEALRKAALEERGITPPAQTPAESEPPKKQKEKEMTYSEYNDLIKARVRAK